MRNILNSHVKLYIVNKDAIEKLVMVSNKYPKYIKHLMTVFQKTPFKVNHASMLADVLRSQIDNRIALKNEVFSILNFDEVEQIDDNINYTLRVHKARKLLKSILSKKYKHLITPKVILDFRYFIDNNASQAEIQDLVGKKLARFNSGLEFELYVSELIRSMNSLEINQIKQKAKKLNTFLIEESNNQLIIQVVDYEASEELGSKSWCISYNRNFWDQYVKDDSILSKIGLSSLKQFFIWDFKRDPMDPLSLVGITVKNGNITSAHDKNDAPMNKKNLSLKYPSLIKEIKITRKEAMANIDKVDVPNHIRELLIEHTLKNIKEDITT
jgi:hypothetical protein